MDNFIPTYRQTKNIVIKICLSCKHVEELPESAMDCPACRLVGHLGMFETPQRFQKYVQLYKPTDLNVIGDHLQYIVDEALERL